MEKSLKTLLVGINSKFIHINMAIRYLKSNCDFPVDFVEFTIKDKIEAITKSIIDKNYDVIGFSCYIWNIKMIKSIAKQVKKVKPSSTIIFGGPETSYDNEEYLLEGIADYIIINEGELAFNQLMRVLHNKNDIRNVDNLKYLQSNSVKVNQLSNIKNLNSLKSPYFFEEDIVHIKNKVQYLELSRGCPYSCTYCLASLEKGLRFFDIDYVFSVIDYLVKNGAKTIKFLDRSFNANKILALDFFKRLVEKDYENTIFQFEINGDVLHQEIIDYLKDNLKSNYIRFELGIQSTNPLVNLAIKRKQNTKTLIENIKQLQNSQIILHLDLIAGLPFEDLNSFKQTFHQIFCLFPSELQLGFLKLLKGTSIRDDAKIHQIRYDEEPPYQIIDNQYISKNDLETIHLVEEMLNIYWNQGFMNNSIKTIVTYWENFFDFFDELGQFHLDNGLSFSRYQLSELFVNLINFLKQKQMLTSAIDDSLKLDYLQYNKIKPKIYWDKNIDKNNILRNFFELNKDFSIDNLYKYGLVTSYANGYLITIFSPKTKVIYYFNNQEIKRIS